MMSQVLVEGAVDVLVLNLKNEIPKAVMTNQWAEFFLKITICRIPRAVLAMTYSQGGPKLKKIGHYSSKT